MSKETAGSLLADLIRAKQAGTAPEKVAELEDRFGKQSVTQLSESRADVTLSINGRQFKSKS